MIVQNVGADGIADISFTVARDELPSALQAAQEAADELHAKRVSHDDDVAKVSVVGRGMAQQTGVARRMFHALADAGTNIQMISTSEIKISVLVSRSEAASALRTVHQAFELDREPAGPKDAGRSSRSTAAPGAGTPWRLWPACSGWKI